MKGDKERCLEAGMDAYLSKPIRSKELFEAIAQLLALETAVAAPAPKAAPTSNAIFDEAALLDRTDGSKELALLLVNTFLNESMQQMQGLDAAVKQHDAKAITASAHALKGAISHFTRGETLQAAMSLEDLARRGDLKGTEAAHRKLHAELERLRGELTAFSHKQSGKKSKAQGAS